MCLEVTWDCNKQSWQSTSSSQNTLFILTDNSRSPTPPSRELSVIEKGITPTTYTFNSSSETNGYIPAESKSNFLTANLDNGASVMESVILPLKSRVQTQSDNAFLLLYFVIFLQVLKLV